MTLREWLARRLWPPLTQSRSSETARPVYDGTGGYLVDQPSDTLTELGHATGHPYLFSCYNVVATAAMGVPLRVYQIGPAESGPRTYRQRYVTGDVVRHARNLSTVLGPRDYATRLRSLGLELTEVDAGHPLRRLLDDVNPMDTYPEFIYKSMVHLQASGDSYWEMVGGKGGKQPTELWVMQPDRVKVNPDPKDFISGYVYEVNGQEIKFAADQVLHCRLPHPTNEFYGLSRGDPLSLVLDTDRNRSLYNNAFFEHGASQSGILVPDGPMEEASWARAVKDWRDRHLGVRNMGKVGMYNFPLKFVPTSVKPRDAEFQGMKAENEHDISGVVGVPRPLTGRTEDVNRSNMDVLEGLFWQHTMVPLLALFCARLTVDLAGRYGEGIIVQADTSHVAALTEDQTQVSDRARQAYDAGIMTLNEARAELRLDPIDGGDVVKRQIATVLQPVDTIGEDEPEPEPEPAPEPEPEEPEPEEPAEPDPEEQTDRSRVTWSQPQPQPQPCPMATEDRDEQKLITRSMQRETTIQELPTSTSIRTYGDARHRRLWQAFDDRTAPRIKELDAALWQYFDAQERAILVALNAQRAYRATVPTDKLLPDPEAAANKLWTIVLASEMAAMEASGAQLLSDLGLSMTFDTENPWVLDYLRHKELLVKTIPEELHKTLRAELLAGNAAGDSIERIAERVSSVYEEVKGYKARRIAQTEVVGAYNVGNVAGMDIAGVAEKEWVATLDDKVRDLHADTHGEQVGIGEEFSNGLQFPGDPLGEASNVINCRCTVVAV